MRELTEKSSSEGRDSIMEKIAAKLRVATSRSFRRPLALAMPLNILYSCSGTSMFTIYMVTIFEQSGSSLDKLHASLVVFNNYDAHRCTSHCEAQARVRQGWARDGP